MLSNPFSDLSQRQRIIRVALLCALLLVAGLSGQHVHADSGEASSCYSCHFSFDHALGADPSAPAVVVPVARTVAVRALPAPRSRAPLPYLTRAPPINS